MNQVSVGGVVLSPVAPYGGIQVEIKDSIFTDAQLDLRNQPFDLKISDCSFSGHVKIPFKIYKARGVEFTEKHIDFGKDGYIGHENGKIYAVMNTVVFEELDGTQVVLSKDHPELVQTAIDFHFQGYAGLTLKEYLEKLGLI